jgi:hypothetical protein
MNAKNFLHNAILLSSFVGLVLTVTLMYKTYFARTKPTIAKKEQYIKLDPSKVNQIKIIKPNQTKTYANKSQRKKMYGFNGRSVSSTYRTASVNDLFGPFGPLKGLSTRERNQFRKQVLGYVDHKIRRGAIERSQRARYIEMRVLDKSLEMLEARAEP